MNVKFRKIEVDAETAATLEARAAAQGISVAEFIAGLVDTDVAPPAALEAMRSAGRGPWTPGILAEDARRFAEFEQSREGIPWDEVQAWMRSWGKPDELPPPKPRKL